MRLQKMQNGYHHSCHHSRSGGRSVNGLCFALALYRQSSEGSSGGQPAQCPFSVLLLPDALAWATVTMSGADFTDQRLCGSHSLMTFLGVGGGATTHSSDYRMTRIEILLTVTTVFSSSEKEHSEYAGQLLLIASAAPGSCHLYIVVDFPGLCLIWR